MLVTHTGESVSVDCPAKLNLTLAVNPPRQDGYHPIASVMAAIDFSDRLSITPIHRGPSRFDRAWAPDAPRKSQIDWPIEKDLVFKAHRLVEQEAGSVLPVDCNLTKSIPVGAGLGGGSSNAAGMLLGMSAAYELALTKDRLLAMAKMLGADVSFALMAMLGQPAALVTGIGQRVEPIVLAPSEAVLVMPEGACPTGAVYSTFDAELAKNPTSARTPEALASLAKQWQRHKGTLPPPMNDLQNAAELVCPPVSGAFATLDALKLETHLTGSGSAIFCLTSHREQAIKLTERIQQAGLKAITTRLLDHSEMGDC